MKLIKYLMYPFMLAPVVFPLLAHPARAAGEERTVTPMPKPPPQFIDARRIVVLGDSITQAGDYIVDLECWLLSQGIPIEVLNLGLGSETATALTAEENREHKEKFTFERPWIGERLDRALEATKPDLLIACYGMNDGCMPSGETTTRRFAEAVAHLRDTAFKAGVKQVVLCTPPVHDNKGDLTQNPHDQNLERFTAWLLSKRAEGWDIVDIHTPMRKALEAGRANNPKFLFAEDGVHPGREGHWLMARQILTQYLGANLDGKTCAEDFFPAHGVEIRKLVQDRLALRYSAWMTRIGHKRPGVPGGPGASPGLSVAEANAKAAEITKKISQLIGSAPALKEYNFFWWDGGFRAVHNAPRPDINPNGLCHVLTPQYRLDISREEATIKGFSSAPDDGPDALLHGLTIPPNAWPLNTSIAVEIEGQRFHVDPRPSTQRALMIYDSGSIAQKLHLKGIQLIDEKGQPHKQVEMEITFVCWQDLVAVTWELLNAGNRLPFSGAAKIEITFSGSFYPALLIQPQETTTMIGTHQYAAKGNTARLYLAFAPVAKDVTVTATRLTDRVGLPVAWNPTYAAFMVSLDGYTGKDPYRLQLSANTALTNPAPCRLVLAREGGVSLRSDGTIDTNDLHKNLNVMGSYPVAFDMNLRPNGGMWQVSSDIHEFKNYPQPYPRLWLHLYRQASCSVNQPFSETVNLAWANTSTQPAAQFCQLSLLGWDDNPKYSGNHNLRAIQLWIQGLINQAEITCLSPDSYMCGNVITDIRPIDQTHSWGANMGGGDFLRFDTKTATNECMEAARVHFLSYGPYLGTARIFNTSTHGEIIGTVDASILAANDIARIWFDCRYEVIKDVEAQNIQIAFLGCPTYDYSALARYAWGDAAGKQNDALLKSTLIEESEVLPIEPKPGVWVAAYRGGVIDEQNREPNANRGMVIRKTELSLAGEPDARLSLHRIAAVKRFVSTSQFQLRLDKKDGTPVRLQKGDRIRVVFEYVPVLKYHTDYARAGHCPAYYQILRDHPDSFEPVAYEAKHGAWRFEDLTGAAVDPDAAFPTLTNIKSTASFTLVGGGAFTPLRIKLKERPAHLTLSRIDNGQLINALTEAQGAPPYQLDKLNGEWLVTILLRGSPASAEEEPQRRRFVLKLQGADL